MARVLFARRDSVLTYHHSYAGSVQEEPTLHALELTGGMLQNCGETESGNVKYVSVRLTRQLTPSPRTSLKADVISVPEQYVRVLGELNAAPAHSYSTVAALG